ncbi:hypothetical protein AN641_07705 [Candidatus Epulonipiscioides gigas]|nr:hypothetical protein AN641_07705 [Epulopiscium sp. SCG-C07WGA-EpuloA2]
MKFQANIIPKNFVKIIEQIKPKYPEIEFIYGEKNIEQADIMLGMINFEKLLTLPNIKYVQLQSAGFDFLANKKHLNHIRFASASGAYNSSTSEHMLTMNLVLFRNFQIHRDFQNQNIWQKWGMVERVRLIKGSTILIIGLGEIGGAYAKLVKAMGAYVIGVRHSNAHKPEYVDELYLANKLDELLPRADVVAVAAPLNDNTKQLIDKAAIEKMKDGAILINVGRGAIVNTDALCDALESGKLSGAALDVTDPEPLPKEHRLWKIKSAIITPHCAGGTGNTGINEGVAKIFEQNLQRFIENKKLINEIYF